MSEILSNWVNCCVGVYFKAVTSSKLSLEVESDHPKGAPLNEDEYTNHQSLRTTITRLDQPQRNFSELHFEALQAIQRH